MSGYSFVLGECFTCGRRFTFNAYLVPSAYIDPATGRPPDVDEHGRPQSVDDREALARARREPICSTCIVVVNEKRVANGLEPIAILPGAYEAMEGVPSDE